MIVSKLRRALPPLLVAAFLLCLAYFSAPAAEGSYEPETDYSLKMLEAVLAGDGQAGKEAQRLRDEKLRATGLDYPPLDYAELELAISPLINY